MFSHINRKLSKSENIKSFIDNIKHILNQQTINDLVESYGSSKLDQQRTFQLKLLTLRIEKNNKSLLEDLHLNNSHFNYMISDLANSFNTFLPVEINDFLSLHRKALSIGVNFLTKEQSDSIFEHLKHFRHNGVHQMPIRASILHSFSTLGIENDYVYKDMDRNSFRNPRASDFLQVFKAMNFNSFYFNEEIFTKIDGMTPLIIGKISDIDTYVQSLDQSLLLCELYNIKPSSSTLKCYTDFFHQAFKTNRYSVLKLFLCAKNRVLPHLTMLAQEVKRMVKYPPKEFEKFVDLVMTYKRLFPDDLDSNNLLLKALKEKIYLESTNSNSFRMKMLTLMTTNTFDEEIFNHCLECLINSKENYKNLLFSIAFYQGLTGKSILDHPLLSPYNYSIENIINKIDIIQLSSILESIHDNLSPLQDQSKALISLIESNIALKAKKDPYLTTFILDTLIYNCKNSSNPANTQLLQSVQKSLNLSNPPIK